jgi:hypothetical protein
MANNATRSQKENTHISFPIGMTNPELHMFSEPQVRSVMGHIRQANISEEWLSSNRDEGGEKGLGL